MVEMANIVLAGMKAAGLLPPEPIGTPGRLLLADFTSFNTADAGRVDDAVLAVSASVHVVSDRVDRAFLTWTP